MDIADWQAAAADLGFDSNVISFSLPECSGSPFVDDRDLSQNARVPSRGKRARSPDWGDEETTALVSLWADNTVQVRFSSMGRNKPIWEDISMEMRKLSYNRTAEMCKNKMTISRQYTKR